MSYLSQWRLRGVEKGRGCGPPPGLYKINNPVEILGIKHVSCVKSILEPSLVGIDGYVLEAVHQRLPHVFNEYKNGKI